MDSQRVLQPHPIAVLADQGQGTDRRTQSLAACTPCNPASPIPLYAQIREALRTSILAGSYRSDARMPSENEMVRAFGVSRITVRQALNDLQKEGLIFKIHGKGTYVSRPKAVQNLMRLEGFGEAMSAAGHETHSQVLGHRVLRPGKPVCARLALHRMRLLERADDAGVLQRTAKRQWPGVPEA